MFDRQKVRAINAEIEAAITEVVKRHNLSFQMGNSKFSKTEITTKYTVSMVGSEGVGMTKEAKNWDFYAPANGIKDFKIGDRIKPQGSAKVFKLLGWNTRSPKYPIIAESDGKTYKLTPMHVRFAVKY